jgi:hypothetical protein
VPPGTALRDRYGSHKIDSAPLQIPVARVTLTQYLIEQQRDHGTVSPELRLLIEIIARACKAISHAVSKGPLTGIGDAVGTHNIQEEAQKKLDVIANEVLVRSERVGRTARRNGFGGNGCALSDTQSLSEG